MQSFFVLLCVPRFTPILSVPLSLPQPGQYSPRSSIVFLRNCPLHWKTAVHLPFALSFHWHELTILNFLLHTSRFFHFFFSPCDIIIHGFSVSSAVRGGDFPTSFRSRYWSPFFSSFFFQTPDFQVVFLFGCSELFFWTLLVFSLIARLLTPSSFGTPVPNQEPSLFIYFIPVPVFEDLASSSSWPLSVDVESCVFLSLSLLSSVWSPFFFYLLVCTFLMASYLPGPLSSITNFPCPVALHLVPHPYNFFAPPSPSTPSLLYQLFCVSSRSRTLGVRYVDYPTHLLPDFSFKFSSSPSTSLPILFQFPSINFLLPPLLAFSVVGNIPRLHFPQRIVFLTFFPVI